MWNIRSKCFYPRLKNLSLDGTKQILKLTKRTVLLQIKWKYSICQVEAENKQKHNYQCQCKNSNSNHASTNCSVSAHGNISGTSYDGYISGTSYDGYISSTSYDDFISSISYLHRVYTCLRKYSGRWSSSKSFNRSDLLIFRLKYPLELKKMNDIHRYTLSINRYKIQSEHHI